VRGETHQQKEENKMTIQNQELLKIREEQVQKSYRYEIETTKDTIKHYEELLKRDNPTEQRDAISALFGQTVKTTQKDMEKELAEKRDRLAELEKLIK
jgi:hypothetical protein